MNVPPYAPPQRTSRRAAALSQVPMNAGIPIPQMTYQQLVMMAGMPGASAGPAVAGGVTLLLQLEILKALQHMRRGGGDSDSENEDTKGEGNAQLKDFKSFKKMRRRFERHPDAIVREHVDRMKLELGIVHDSQFWKVTDYCRRSSSSCAAS